MTTICTECGKEIDDGYKKITYVTCYQCAQKKREIQVQKRKNK